MKWFSIGIVLGLSLGYATLPLKEYAATERCLLSQRNHMISEARRERERRAYQRRKMDLQSEILALATIN